MLQRNCYRVKKKKIEFKQLNLLCVELNSLKKYIYHYASLPVISCVKTNCTVTESKI